MIGETILVCRQEVSFSNDFNCFMESRFDIVFDVKDIEEGERMADFFERNFQCHIKPLRIMKAGYGVVYKEF